MTLASPNIILASVGLFLTGAGTDSVSNITFVYMIEVY